LKDSATAGPVSRAVGTVCLYFKNKQQIPIALFDESNALQRSIRLGSPARSGWPNAIWQADHSPLDILLVRPDGEPE
jgi:hypothetical protein